ncbi:MAG: hypothetical protein EOL87_13915 [Spartobacteria bacterium]|nr:hypothetical protein [Spartobacteria bacterium]
MCSRMQTRIPAGLLLQGPLVLSNACATTCALRSTCPTCPLLDSSSPIYYRPTHENAISDQYQWASDPLPEKRFLININAAAILLEVGGMLQHGSLIAREYGKPCIAGVEGLTAHVHDGDRVEMDGAAGIIRLIETEQQEESS